MRNSLTDIQPKPCNNRSETGEKRVADHADITAKKQPSTMVKVFGENQVDIHIRNPGQTTKQFEEALGITEEGFLEPFLAQVANAVSDRGQLDEDRINFMLSVIKGINPRDQIEAMLGAQMAAIHMASMASARCLNNAKTTKQQDSFERALNKLVRAFTIQMEALRKHRTGGEQKVTVHHVNVNEGGQAVVGNVMHKKEKN